jgi:hypothetical protein
VSLGLIPYQPIAFGLEDNCTLPCSSWIQKIERGDRTSFQFTYGACGTTNSILNNGDFTDAGTGWTAVGLWTYVFGWARSPIGGGGNIQQAFSYSGYVELSFGLEVTNGTMVLTSNLGLIGFYSQNGIITTVFDATGMTNINFFFASANGGAIQNVELKPISTDGGIGIADINNPDSPVIPLIPLSDANYITITDGFLTCSIDDWSDLDVPDGCYVFKIASPCQCSQFGFIGDEFNVPNQFVVSVGGSSNVDISGGAMSVTNSGVSAVTVLRVGVLCVGTEYELTYTLTGMAVGDNFRLAAGTANGILRTADGTYTETITVTATNDNAQDLRFIFGFVGGLHAVDVTDFSISATVPIITFTSVPFQLRDSHDCPNCTVLVEACGNGDQLGFGFTGSGFKPMIRLDGTYRGSGYDSVKTSYEFATGKRVNPWGRTRKVKSLIFGAPEYVHDFMQILTLIDNVYIDGVNKHCEDDEYPTISFEADTDMGSVTMTFSDKTELTEKRPCSAVSSGGCSVDGTVLALTGTGGLIFGGSVLTVEGINGVAFSYNNG